MQHHTDQYSVAVCVCVFVRACVRVCVCFTSFPWYHCSQNNDPCSGCLNCDTVKTRFLHTVVAARERLVLHEEWGWSQFWVHLVFAEIRDVSVPEDHMLAGHCWLGRAAVCLLSRAVVRSCCYYKRRSGTSK